MSRPPATRRRAEILAAALALAEQTDYRHITRAEVAQAAGCSPALVAHHFGNMAELREQVLFEAVERECLRVVAQGLIAVDPIAWGAPQSVRAAALRAVS
jgi:AcrR family transcriptional regulator